MSEFARKQLEKYGWSEGKGLGKEENGIVKPIKAALKFDNHGIGHDNSKDLTSRWWCDVFNDAAKRVNVTNTETGVHLHTKKKAVESALPSAALVHKSFVKAEVFTDYKNNSDTSKNTSSDNDSSLVPMSDEVLYSKCEGMKKKCFNYSLMKGKINRIKKQDAIFAEKNRRKKKSKGKRLLSEQEHQSR